jgi:hypothetical protein
MPDIPPQPVSIKNIETPEFSAVMLRFGIDLERWAINRIHFAYSICTSSTDDLAVHSCF